MANESHVSEFNIKDDRFPTEGERAFLQGHIQRALSEPFEMIAGNELPHPRFKHGMWVKTVDGFIGRIESVDPAGGGIYYGVCPSYNIRGQHPSDEKEVLRKDVPEKEMSHVRICDVKPYAFPGSLDDLRGPATGEIRLPIRIY